MVSKLSQPILLPRKSEPIVPSPIKLTTQPILAYGNNQLSQNHPSGFAPYAPSLLFTLGLVQQRAKSISGACIIPPLLAIVSSADAIIASSSFCCSVISLAPDHYLPTCQVFGLCALCYITSVRCDEYIHKVLDLVIN
jgi:hypothetical protein